MKAFYKKKKKEAYTPSYLCLINCITIKASIIRNDNETILV